MGRGSLDFGTKEVHPTEESLGVIVAEESRYCELIGTSVIKAVQFAREGCFLVIYPRRFSLPGKCLTKWVWLDSERMSIVWESEEGVLYRVHLRDVQSIATGGKSKFFCRKLSEDLRPCAFEIRTNRLGSHLRRHYRMLCHDQRECTLWLVALSTTLIKAKKLAPPTLTAGQSSFELDGYKKASTLIESHKTQNIWGKLSRPHVYVNQTTVEDWLKIFWVSELRKELATSRDVMRLLHELGIHADRTHVERLFAREDTDGSGIISLPQFRQIFHELTAHHFIYEIFSGLANPSGGTTDSSNLDGGVPMKVVKQWLLDQQYETAVAADALLSDLIDCNKSYLTNETCVSYLGLFVLLRSNDSLNADLIEAAVNRGDLPLFDYWIKASARPFDSVTSSAQSELAISLRKTIDLGYRCFAIYVEKSTNGKPIVKSREFIEEELSLTSALNVIKGCAFVSTSWPIIILLDIKSDDFADPAFSAIIAGQIENELGSLLVPEFKNGEVPTLAELSGKVIISYCVNSQIDYFGNRQVKQVDLRDAIDRWLYPPRPFDSVDMSEPNYHLSGVAAIKWTNRDSQFQLINRFQLNQFMCKTDADDSQAEQSDERSRSVSETLADDGTLTRKTSFSIEPGTRRGAILQKKSPNNHLLCVVQPPELSERLPVRENNVALYLNHCNIVWEAPLLPSLGAAAIFPKNAAYTPMHKDVTRACALRLELLGGHMLPVAKPSPLGAKTVYSPPCVTIKVYSGRGLIFQDRCIGSESESESPRFNTAFTINLDDEYTSIIIFEVATHGEGSMTPTAVRAQRVIWLKSGLRWVGLRDTLGRVINWSGLWIRTQKQTKEIQQSNSHGGRAMRRLPKMGRTFLSAPPDK